VAILRPGGVEPPTGWCPFGRSLPTTWRRMDNKTPMKLAAS